MAIGVEILEHVAKPSKLGHINSLLDPVLKCMVRDVIVHESSGAKRVAQQDAVPSVEVVVAITGRPRLP
jgi:hypothetical protein